MDTIIVLLSILFTDYEKDLLVILLSPRNIEVLFDLSEFDTHFLFFVSSRSKYYNNSRKKYRKML